MNDDLRIDPTEAFRKVRDDEAILVCAYDDASKCREIHLDGSYRLSELRDRKEDLADDREIVFYCA